MSADAAFWDASALVPVCVVQESSPQAEANLGIYSPVVWWATYVEVRSAIARLRRTGLIENRGAVEAVATLNSIEPKWTVITPDEAVRETACDLLQKYPLRAADSLQLSAALTWCGERPAGRTFLCADRRLSEAARAAGFSVVAF